MKDQITLYDETITDEMIEKAMNMVSLNDEIKRLPKRLETPMKDVNFSQGQLQLLMIARSIVCDPEILLLDEMSASLDKETEEKVMHALNQVSKGRTVLSISHRRSAHDGRLIRL